MVTGIDGTSSMVLTGQDAHERKNSLSHLLKSHICEVTFAKVDGTIRTMPCTLQESILPPAVPKETAASRAVNEANISVWCTDRNEWRSFKTANVIEVKILS